MASIGTSDPLDLCKGLPLLPTGAVRAGVAQAGTTHPLFTTGFTVLFWRFNASAAYDIFLGMCGPSTAFLIDADLAFPQTDQLTLKVNDDTMQGGFIVGFNFGANVDITTETFHVEHWYSPWKGKWEPSWSASLNFSFDLINLIVTLIEKVLEGEEGAQAFLRKLSAVDSRFNGALTSTWGMFDQRQDQLISSQGILTADPTFTLPINIVPLTAEIPVIDIVAAFDEVLSKVGGWFALGPTLSLEVPITLNLDHLEVCNDSGCQQFTIRSYDSSTHTITASGDAVSSPSVISANVSYRAGFTIGAGVFLSLGAFKVFSLNLNSPSVDLLKLFGLPEPVGATQTGTTFTDYPDGVLFDPVLLSLDLPQHNPVQAGLSHSAMVHVSEAQDQDTVVTLTSDNSSAGIPSSVTIPANQTSVGFNFTPQNQCSFIDQTVLPGSTYTVNVVAEPQDPNTGIIGDTASFIVTNVTLTGVNDPSQGGQVVHLSQSPQGFGLRLINIQLPFPAPAGGFSLPPFTTTPTPPNIQLLDDSLNPVPLEVGAVSGTFFSEGETQAAPAGVEFYQGGTNFANTLYVIIDGGCTYGQVRIRYDVYQN